MGPLILVMRCNELLELFIVLSKLLLTCDFGSVVEHMGYVLEAMDSNAEHCYDFLYAYGDVIDSFHGMSSLRVYYLSAVRHCCVCEDTHRMIRGGGFSAGRAQLVSTKLVPKIKK